MPGNQTIPFYDRVLCDDLEGPALFRSVQIDLIQLGGGAFLTEFGGCDGSPTCDEQIDWGLDAADQFLQSWAFWGNTFGEQPSITRISRVYARAIAGQPIAMQYIAGQRSFYLSYFIDTTIRQPTVIFIPPVQFPQHAYNVTVNAVLQWRVDPSNANVILVEPRPSVATANDSPLIGVVEIRPNM